MNVRFFKVLKLLIVILVIYTILDGFSIFFFGGLMDFPCFVEYNEANNCIEAERLSEIEKERKDLPQIESFFTIYQAGWKGGRCHYEKSETNFLKVKTFLTTLRFERINGDLKVNNRFVKKNEEINIKSFFNIEPWSIFQLKLKNLGLAADCNSTSTEQKLIIVGSYGTEPSSIKGFLILSILIGGLIFVNKYSKKI